MNWLEIALIALLAVTSACVAVKLVLRRKLDDIDGFGGIHKQGDRNGEKIIGCFGDKI